MSANLEPPSQLARTSKKNHPIIRLVILPCVVFILLSAGCEYEVPVTTEHSLKIDPAVLGLWEAVPQGNQAKERILVLKYSDSEYLVNYQESGSLYFRAYPVKLDGLSMVQLQAIGNNEGPLEKKDPPYQLVVYSFNKDVLEIKTLNSSLIDKNSKTSKELQEAILKHKADKDLFGDPGRFKKVREAR